MTGVLYLMDTGKFKHHEKEESEMSVILDVERPCTIAESIKYSCLEVKSMREGKVPKRSWKEFRQSMEAEMEKGD